MLHTCKFLGLWAVGLVRLKAMYSMLHSTSLIKSAFLQTDDNWLIAEIFRVTPLCCSSKLS